MFDNLTHASSETSISFANYYRATAVSQTHDDTELPLVALRIGVRRNRYAKSVSITDTCEVLLRVALFPLFVLERQTALAKSIRMLFSSIVHSKVHFSNLAKHSLLGCIRSAAIASSLAEKR